MRLDSPVSLSIAGTIAVHLILIVAGDAVQVYNPPRKPPPAPRIEMFEIEVPPVIVAPPPPPVAVPELPKPEPEQPIEQPRVVRTVRTAQPEVVETATKPDPNPVTDTAPGGDQVVTLDTAPPGATGVAVAVGRQGGDRVGRGGAGGGPGSGIGQGTGNDPPAPVSVATIKKRALPKGDYEYFGKEYPTEARQLAIEGLIKVRLVVDARGKVVSAVLLNKLGHGLDELAMRHATQIEFEPAVDTDDRPVTSVVIWTFTMTLPK